MNNLKNLSSNNKDTPSRARVHSLEAGGFSPRKTFYTLRPIYLSDLVALFCRLLFALLFGMASNASGANVPPGFTETPLSGPWQDAVGLTSETNGRMYVWERTGRVWIKDPGDTPSLLLDISEEVGAWEDHR